MLIGGERRWGWWFGFDVEESGRMVYRAVAVLGEENGSRRAVEEIGGEVANLVNGEDGGEGIERRLGS